MSAKDLRSKVIRLAHSNPELREHLLPLVTEKTANTNDDDFLLLIDDIKKALGKRDSGALKRIRPSKYGITNPLLDAELSSLMYALSYLVKR